MVALLAQVPMFLRLNPAQLARIAQAVRISRHGKGEIIFQVGDACHGFHVVLAGQIKLGFMSPHGQEKVVEIISPGQSFGEAIMFMERNYVVFAQALVDTVLLHIPKAVLFDELASDPALGRMMLASLSLRLHQLIMDVEAYSLHSGKERIIGFLLRELSGDLPDDESESQLSADPVTLTLPASKGTIASRLNLTQEHFSRMLHELADLGLISIAGRKIHIPDPLKLRGFQP